MRSIIFLIACISTQLIWAQYQVKEVATEIKHVTVFLSGAEIEREASISIPPGKHRLEFKQLSPYIDQNSIQLSGIPKGLSILSVYSEREVQNKKKSQKQDSISQKIEQLNLAISQRRNDLQIMQNKIQFLQDNRKISGSEKGISAQNLKEISSYYQTEIDQKLTQQFKLNNELQALNSELELLKQKNFQLREEVLEYKGKIILIIDAKTALSTGLKLTYLVNNASWIPVYDAKVQNINSPLQLNYKAKITQNTEIDWKNIPLSLSTSNPSVSSVIPEIKPYYLKRYATPPGYSNTEIYQVSGIVTDENGESLPGVSIIIENSSIGTVSDIEGRFQLTLPRPNAAIELKFVGYENKRIIPYKEFMVIQLNPSQQVLQEVVIQGYAAGTSTKRKRQGRKESKPRIIDGANYDQESENWNLKVETKTNSTNVSFEIQEQYTINSGSTNNIIIIGSYNIPAEYEYVAKPLINQNTYLKAIISDWEQYNLLEGECNLYLEGSFKGTTILDTRSANKKYALSMGIDKAISIQRKTLSYKEDKAFIGNKITVEQEFELVVKNNKSIEIPITIFDQIPVSKLDEIEVDIKELNGGNVNKSNGEVSWKFNLDSNTSKSIQLEYDVTFPKEYRIRF